MSVGVRSEVRSFVRSFRSTLLSVAVRSFVRPSRSLVFPSLRSVVPSFLRYSCKVRSFRSHEVRSLLPSFLSVFVPALQSFFLPACLGSFLASLWCLGKVVVVGRSSLSLVVAVVAVVGLLESLLSLVCCLSLSLSVRPSVVIVVVGGGDIARRMGETAVKSSVLGRSSGSSLVGFDDRCSHRSGSCAGVPTAKNSPLLAAGGRQRDCATQHAWNPATPVKLRR